MNNYLRNKSEIDKFRKQLKSMVKDISDIDEKVLIKSVNVGLASAKRGTPVDTGFMRKMWGTTPLKKVRKKGVEKALYNAADYSSFVNDGHRIVNKAGETIGFVKGKHIVERADKAVRRTMKQEFIKEVEKVNKKHGK
mgnify:CR=1 FL=1